MARKVAMRVKCIRNIVEQEYPDTPWYPDLTLGKEYKVLCIEEGYFRIVGDDGEPYLYPPDLFQITDSRPETTWVLRKDKTGAIEFYGPPELDKVGLFEDYFEGAEYATKILEAYLRKNH